MRVWSGDDTQQGRAQPACFLAMKLASIEKRVGNRTGRHETLPPP